MKTTINMLLALAAVSVNLHAMNQAPPAPLPDFMDKAQLAKWNADQASAQTASSPTATESSNQFYTGKPYVADVGGYIYKYRTYNPEMSRWTSADPSGFPDSSNNRSYVSNPLSHLDPNGLKDYTIVATTSSSSTSSNSSGTYGLGYGSYIQNFATEQTAIPTSAPGVSSGTATGYGGGDLAPYGGGSPTNVTNVSESFNLTINTTTGNITLVAASGTDVDSNGNLQTGLTWTITGSGTQQVTLNIESASIYQGSGINGIGGAGGSVSWTSGRGETADNTSITFNAE
jgi:RHS repeat-associated protein